MKNSNKNENGLNNGRVSKKQTKQNNQIIKL